MKKIFYLLIPVFLFISCSDELDTSPTNSVTPDVIFQDADAAYVALNGMYRLTYGASWGGFNGSQSYGIAAVTLSAELQGDDMVQREQGSGWYYFDYGYRVKQYYVNDGWRPYTTWEMCYTIISNANYLLAYVNEDTPGDIADINSILGQAYAIRAYFYFMLIQTYQKTYIGHENDPGVPIYTEPTYAGMSGNPRGTVQDVYDLINSDLEKASTYLKDVKTRVHASHIDYYTVNGIKARVALVQNKFDDALTAAQTALSKSGLSYASADAIKDGFNNVAMQGVLWAVEVPNDQSPIWGSYGAHMDASFEMYAYRSRKCISSWLYTQLGTKDARLAWWNGKLATDESLGVNCSYNQFKFRFKKAGAYDQDIIYMRAEEMLLIQAESYCRKGNYAEARKALQTLGNLRDEDYATRLAAVTDSNEQTFSSTGTVKTLMDEVLVQRRIELWGEVGRIYDILRLKKGFYRNWDGSNHSILLDANKTTNPEWWGPILTIPQAEFDANINMDISEQNKEEE